MHCAGAVDREGGRFRDPMDILLMISASLWAVAFHCTGVVDRERGQFRVPMDTLLAIIGAVIGGRFSLRRRGGS